MIRSLFEDFDQLAHKLKTERSEGTPELRDDELLLIRIGYIAGCMAMPRRLRVELPEDVEAEIEDLTTDTEADWDIIRKAK